MNDLMPRAAALFLEIVRAIKPDQLTAPTPCAEYDVRALIDHLLQWGPPLEGAGRKEAVPPAEGVDDWAPALEAQVQRTLAAWNSPAAWEGMTTMGGAFELPAPLVGGMVIGEFVLHGWDLARAMGQRPEWDADLVEYLYGEVARSAEQGREMGVYGEEVAVPANASTVDKMLALSGRSPSWPD
ncbi:TIGR03086 family metal-binding protein [Allokutzneria oryzae]|uniref:TIGR03086 family metal-binding protein n=1 Tax=Allokutzneria oryzae TaxID=1378989 RepID=A0ABV5ZXV0_9PSEU